MQHVLCFNVSAVGDCLGLNIVFLLIFLFRLKCFLLTINSCHTSLQFLIGFDL